MKCPASEGKGNSATEVAREDFEDFDYYWQHLRRNVGYIMASAGIWWNEEVATHSFRGSRRHALDHQWREFQACCLLPTPVTREKDSDDALRSVLKSKPDFFETAQWQTIKAKASAHKPVAIWNWSGPHRCAWRDYYEGEKHSDKLWKDPRDGYYEHFALRKDPRYPDRNAVNAEFRRLRADVELKEREASDLKCIEHSAKQHGRTVEEELKLKIAEWKKAQRELEKWSDGDRHDVADEFASLHMSLEITEQEASHEKRLEYWAKQRQCTVEEARKLKQAECEAARASMRRFLEAHPQMDFVADTRLPWATVSRAMESEWNRIKDLRRRVGLEANEQPPRKREWKKQLEIFDAYFPHWLENRKKIAALPRIWRENLGFQEAFKLLKIELTPAATELAQRLDKQGLKPKGIFKYAVKVRRTLERASYNEALSPELSAETKHNVGEQHFFDEQKQVVPASDFDYEEVYATLDGAGVNVVCPRSESSEAAQDILQSWRPHFSIPKAVLPPTLARLKADTRREWFNAARKRIEALWPLSYEEVMGPQIG